MQVCWSLRKKSTYFLLTCVISSSLYSETCQSNFFPWIFLKAVSFTEIFLQCSEYLVESCSRCFWSRHATVVQSIWSFALPSYSLNTNFPAARLDIPVAAELLPVLGRESGWAEKSSGSCDQRSTSCLGWAMVKEVLHGPCSHAAELVVDTWTFQQTCLESSEKQLLWMRELRFFLEDSPVCMFWGEQVAYT